MANPIMTRPLEVQDFSGGKTDNYISCAVNQFQDADNFLLRKHGSVAKLITRPGSSIFEDFERHSEEERISTFFDNEGVLFAVNGRVVECADGIVEGPTSNPALDQATVSTYHSWARWNKHILLVDDAFSRPVKIYNNGTDQVVRTLGLPNFSGSSVTTTFTAGASNLNIIYAFIRTDSYAIGTVTFREVSAVSFKAVTPAGVSPIDAGTPCALSTIPVLSNGATDNYNTAGLKVEIYRTTDGGTTFYYVGEVTNGTTTFNDTVPDASLVNNATLYTEGGVSDFTQVPRAKYVVVQGDTAFYLNIKKNSEILGNRVRQSIPGSPYASPEDYYVDISDDITGGGVAGNYPVVFSLNKAYRIEGRIDSFGQGSLIAREISGTVGCVSHRSIVPTKDGLYFASLDGFYVTDGFGVRKISDFNESYSDIVQSEEQYTNIYGSLDTTNNQIWWACKLDSSLDDNDFIFVAHLDAANTPFTTLSGGYSADNFSPTALLFFNKQMVRGDRRGYILVHDTSITTDPRIDESLPTNEWSTAAIIYDYRGPAFDFGLSNVRKWVPRIVLNADNVTNLSLRIFSNNDNSGLFTELAEIKYGGALVWDDEEFTWGDPEFRWNYTAVLTYWRRFPTPLRCSYKQIRLTSSLTLIESSEELGVATTSQSGATITLDDTTKDFTSNAIGYRLYLANDNYTRSWEIIERASDTVLVVDDPTNILPDLSGIGWKIKGYKKGEILNLLSYSIENAPISMSQESFSGESA